MSETNRLDAALHKAFLTMPDCIVMYYLDLSTGLLMGMKSNNQMPQEAIDLIAAVMTDMFQGPNVSMMETLARKYQGMPEDEHFFQTILTMNGMGLQLAIRGKRYPDYVTVFYCRSTANLGMIMARARMAIPMIEEGM